MATAGMTAATAGSKAAQDVSALLRARNPLIWIVTREEARVERFLWDAAQAATFIPRCWDCADGITDINGEEVAPGTNAKDPASALEAIKASREKSLWILRDLTPWLRDPTILRGIRNLARTLPSAPVDQARSIIILTPSAEVPPELADHAILIEWPLPDRAEMGELLDAALRRLPEDLRAAAAPNGTREAAIDAAVGLSAEEASSCYARSLIKTRKIDPPTVAAEKKRVIAREKVLEWYDPIPEGLDAVGGYDAAKDWIRAHAVAFTADARAFGLPAPRGILLLGHPGCGKSLLCKAIATGYGVPLLRLDLGALKGPLVGQSEGLIRKALKVVETISKCVVWVDEIEKGLAGATQGAADGGVSADALGTLLSWMQERSGSIFVVATANDVRALPPELLRKGRFDEIFFVDLPNEEERASILRAALRTVKRTAGGLDVPRIVAATKDFTGAEIAGLVPEALFTAYADKKRSLKTEDILTAAGSTVPLAKTKAEKIEELRKWAAGRARQATRTVKVAKDADRRLDV